MRVVPERIRELRIRRLLTQAELAQQTNMTESTLSRIENGLQEPRISTVRKLAVALGVSPDELIDWAGADDASDMGKAAA